MPKIVYTSTQKGSIRVRDINIVTKIISDALYAVENVRPEGDGISASGNLTAGG